MSVITAEIVTEYEFDLDEIRELFPDEWESFEGDEYEFLSFLLQDEGHSPESLGAESSYSHITLI